MKSLSNRYIFTTPLLSVELERGAWNLDLWVLANYVSFDSGEINNMHMEANQHRNSSNL